MFFTIHSERDTSLYTLAWITCDNEEYQAARLMLDKQHGDYAPLIDSAAAPGTPSARPPGTMSFSS
jgi:hypothetical protein